MEWFNNLFGRKPTSKDIARDRLKMVLITDRANCSTDLLEMLRNDILKVLANYMEIDESESNIRITQDVSDQGAPVPVLYVDIPIKNMRKPRG